METVFRKLEIIASFAKLLQCRIYNIVAIEFGEFEWLILGKIWLNYLRTLLVLKYYNVGHIKSDTD